MIMNFLFIFLLFLIEYLNYKLLIHIPVHKLLNNLTSIIFCITVFTSLQIYYIQWKLILTTYIFIFCHLSVKDNIIYLTRIIILIYLAVFGNTPKQSSILYLETFVIFKEYLEYLITRDVFVIVYQFTFLIFLYNIYNTGSYQEILLLPHILI